MSETATLFEARRRDPGEWLCDTEERPLLLDVFCGAGGASVGFHRAGFDVVGVDIAPQPNYPFRFVQADALAFLDWGSWNEHTPEKWFEVCGSGFAAVHASPPCQTFTDYRRKGHGVGDGYENLIPVTRELLEKTGLPYVIENVEKARPELRAPVMLCGSMFGLDVRRHRLFETNWPLAQPECSHGWQRNLGKRYPGATNRDGRFTCEVGVWRIPLEVQKIAMGVSWNYVTLEELSEMVPPRYTQYVGSYLHACVGLTEAVA